MITSTEADDRHLSQQASWGPAADVWSFGRRVSLTLLTVYAMRVAAVFAISTTTIAARLGLALRWLTVSAFRPVSSSLFRLGVHPPGRGRLPGMGVRVQCAHARGVIPAG